jgi:predicted HicB family RNase H-like nuclease
MCSLNSVAFCLDRGVHSIVRLEFNKSLKVFLDVCKEKGIEPYKEYSGKFNLRIPPELHAEIASRALAEGKSLNQWIVQTIDQFVHTL